MSTKISQDGSQTKPTVLVVDDEAGPLDALKVILRPFFNIRSADNAQAALDVLSHESIDLITLDQKLPDRQGIDLLQDIKHDHADIEVIIITGYGSLKSAMEGLRHGAAGYLLKDAAPRSRAPSPPLAAVYRLDVNEFNGTETLQLVVEHWSPV